MTIDSNVSVFIKSVPESEQGTSPISKPKLACQCKYLKMIGGWLLNFVKGVLVCLWSIMEKTKVDEQIDEIKIKYHTRNMYP